MKGAVRRVGFLACFDFKLATSGNPFNYLVTGTFDSKYCHWGFSTVASYQKMKASNQATQPFNLQQPCKARTFDDHFPAPWIPFPVEVWDRMLMWPMMRLFPPWRLSSAMCHWWDQTLILPLHSSCLCTLAQVSREIHHLVGIFCWGC